MKTMNEIRALRVKPAYATALFVLLGLTWFSAPASAQGSLIVDITSPTSGATVSNTIPVNANVTIVGMITVVGVQFKLDGANLGAEDTTSPYSVQWNTRTASNGSHTLTAVARDALGIPWTSSPVTVTVFNDITPPTVAVTSPSPGSFVRGTIPVDAGASDNVGVVGVQFRVDGANLDAEDTTSPYGVSWDTTTATGGSHVLSAVARDAAGNTTTSGGITVTVDNVPPTVSINQAGGQADPTSASPINFTVAFSEAVTGFTAADVTISGTAGGTIATAVSGGPSTYTVAVSGMTDGTVIASIAAGLALDAAGNANTASTSTDNTVTFATPPTTTTRVENTDLSISYAPGAGPQDWFHGSRSRSWSAATASFNRSAGARATFQFTGTSVSWISFRAWWSGIAKVYVDGVFQRDVDLYLGAEGNPLAAPCDPDGGGPQQAPPGCVDEEVQARVFTWTADPPTPGPHTLTIEVTGQRNPLVPADCGPGNCNAVVVDAFDVGPSVPPPAQGARREETSPAPAMAYSAGWTQGDTSKAWSGQTAAVSTTDGAQATFNFTGTSVSWIGLRGPQTGIARIFLDGAFQTQVDTYSPDEFQARVSSVTDLAPAGHSLTIEVAGKRPIATSNLIVVDAFDVGSRFEERDPSVVYTGAWNMNNDNKAWSGASGNSGPGTAAFSQTAGASAEFTFTGTSVSWIGYRADWAGLADVSVDGGPATRVDLYSPTEQLRAPVFTSAELPSGPHTLRIDVTGAQNPASMGAFVFVDAFDVAVPSPGLRVSRFQETDPALSPSYQPMGDWHGSGWVHGSGFIFSSGERAMFSSMAGARATFTFTGTSITWIGDRSQNTGIARVSVDGGPPVEVDTYANVVGDTQRAIFTQGGLPLGVHTLTIEVTGLKNPWSGSPIIFIDALDVQDGSFNP